MKRARQRKDSAIAITMIEQVTSQLSEHHSSDRSTKAYHSRYRGYCASGKQVRRQGHYKRRPGLLSEEGDAEDHNRQFDGNAGHQQHRWHHCGAQSEGKPTREGKRALSMLQKPT